MAKNEQPQREKVDLRKERPKTPPDRPIEPVEKQPWAKRF